MNLENMSDPELQEKLDQLHQQMEKLLKETDEVRAKSIRISNEQYRRYRKFCDKFKVSS